MTFLHFLGFLGFLGYFGNIFVFFVTHYVWMFSKLRDLIWPGPWGFPRYPRSICPRGGLRMGCPRGWPVGFDDVIIGPKNSKNDVMYFGSYWTIREDITIKPFRGHEMVYPTGPRTLFRIFFTKAPENTGWQYPFLVQKSQKYQMSGPPDWTSGGPVDPYSWGFDITLSPLNYPRTGSN